MLSQNQKLQIAVIVLYSFVILMNLIFLGFYIRRVNKLDKQASISYFYLPKSRINSIRIFLIVFLIILQFIDIMLSELDPFYWMNQFKYLALVNILVIINYLLQIYIIRKEFKKKARRSRTLIVYWMCFGFLESIIIVVVEVFVPNTGIILIIFNVLGLAGLIGLTLNTDAPPPSNMQTLEDSLRQGKLLPIVGDAERASFSQFQKIYIQFNKDFEVHLQDDENFAYFFKIAVYIGGQSHIITKTEQQFIQLANKLIQIFPTCETVKIKGSQRRRTTNIMKYVEQRQKVYETYLVQLTKNSQFYAEPLINFLNISHAKRGMLTQSKFRVLKKDTINSDQQDKNQQPFFTVKSKDNTIYVVNHQILTLKICKTQAEIKAFHQKLLNQKRLKVQLLAESSQLPQHMHFIDRVVNSKYLWRSFSEWIRLGMTLEDKIFNMFDFWNLGFKNIQIEIIGHQIAFDKQGSVVNLYLLSMTRKNGQAKDSGTTLKKRFKDFARLNFYINKFIEQRKLKNIQLPSLPPKISPFGTKTSPNARQVYLDTYIKQLIKVQGINHCIKLLEFLEIDNDTVAEQFYTLTDSTQAILDIGMNLDNLTRHEQTVKISENNKNLKQSDDIFSNIKIEQLQLEKI